jgi:ribosomal protein L22
MERLQKIFSTWAKQENEKTELASEKVELNIVANITKAIGKVDKAEKSLADIRRKALDAFDKHERGLLKVYDKALDDQSKLFDKLKANQDVTAEAKKVLASAEKAAKELGLKANGIPNYDMLKNMIDNYPGLFNNTSASVDRIDKAKL